MSINCRHCETTLSDVVFDLGHQPLSNDYLKKSQLELGEVHLPLKLYLCRKCDLVQIPEYKSAEETFRSDYAYLSSTSKTLLNHSKKYVDKVVSELQLNDKKFVIEIASNDGYLLKNFLKYDIPVLGIEPTKIAAKLSKDIGINTIKEFFDTSLASEIFEKYGKADLIIANNVLPHVPNINDFLKGIKVILKDEGYVSIEFQHLLSLLEKDYWDTIYHEHYNYLTLMFLHKALKKFGFKIVNFENISTHGGSIRLWLKHSNSKEKEDTKCLENIIKQEQKAGCNSTVSFETLQKKALKVKIDLVEFLIKLKKQNQKIVAFGAAAKGNTLLNYSGINHDLVPYVIDSSKSKQGLYLPGSKILVTDISIIDKIKPQNILILPWNLKKEILEQLSDYNGINFYTAIPELQKIS